MSDLLDQNEIDALLSAVETTDGDADEQQESTAVYSRGRAITDADIEIRPYDFKRPERVSKDQMRALENLHEIGHDLI